MFPTSDFANCITIQAAASPGMGLDEVFMQTIALSTRLGCWLDLDCGACRILVNSRSDLKFLHAQYTVGCERKAAEDQEKLRLVDCVMDAKRAAPIEERVYVALQSLDVETNGEVESHLNNACHGNLTVCPVCQVDDFVHVQGCRLSPNTGRQ